MRKLLPILIVTLALSVSLKGQSIFTEDFSAGTMPPTGWSIDAHTANWSNVDSDNAGGTTPEAMFSWDPDFIGDSRLISPIVVTTGYTELLLKFKHFVDDYGGYGGYSVGVATRSAMGPWNVAWELDVMENVGPETKIVLLETADVGSDSFEFCIFFSGDSYNVDYWYIDDVELLVPKMTDGVMYSIDMSAYSLGDILVGGSILNMGLEAITSLDISAQVDEEPVINYSLTGMSIIVGQSYSFVGDYLDLAPGDHPMKLWIVNVNGAPDEDLSNDTLETVLHVASLSVARRPLFEEFTSSTCGPCANFNTNVFNPFVEAHGDEMTLIKYQMYWPSPGDPYYTEEGGVRMDYYGVGYVPDLYVDGMQTETTSGGVSDAFSNSLLTPAFLDLAAYHAIDGSLITVNVDIMPHISGTFEVQIVVFENVTTGNIGSNGETEFHHVMMKMLPDAFGTTIELTDGVTSSLEYSADLSSTNVEEMDDLGVAVFIQEPMSQMIFQSGYSDETGVGIGDPATLSSVRFYPSPGSGLFRISGLEKAADISIYNSFGQEVRRITGFYSTALDLQCLPSGNYFIRIDGQAARMVTITK
jgi:hypothetical protein